VTATRKLRYLSAAAVFAVAAAVSASAHEMLLGVGTHFIDLPAAQPALLSLAVKVRADSMRADSQWSLVETTRGAYRIPAAWDRFVSNARSRGLEPLLILDYGNKLYDDGKLPRSADAIAGFVRFATFVVKHFAGRVRYYEVWNEWNTGTGGYYPGGSAHDYARLFNATYSAIKPIAPNTVVLAAAGYHDWYAQIAKLGVAARADGVAIHPYVAKELGYQASIGSNGPERSAERLIEAEAIMRQLSGGREVPLYITEIGWSTSSGEAGYSEQDVATMAERSLLMFAALPYVRGVWWYDLIDDGSDAAQAEDRFGLFRQSHALKPAARIVQSLARTFRHDDLTWNPQSHPGAGLIVLNRGSSPAPSVIAWHVHSSPEEAEKSDWRYVVSCDPGLRVVRAAYAISPSDQTITAAPAVFTYRAGHCTRARLSGPM